MVYRGRHESKEQDGCAELLMGGDDHSVPWCRQDLVLVRREGSERDSSHEISSLSAHFGSSNVFVYLFLTERLERARSHPFPVRRAGWKDFRSGECHYSRATSFLLADGRHQPEGSAGRSPALTGSQCVRTRLRGRS